MQLVTSIRFQAMSHLVYLLLVGERNRTPLPTYVQLLIPFLSFVLHLAVLQPPDKPAQHCCLTSFPAFFNFLFIFIFTVFAAYLKLTSELEIDARIDARVEKEQA